VRAEAGHGVRPAERCVPAGDETGFAVRPSCLPCSQWLTFSPHLFHYRSPLHCSSFLLQSRHQPLRLQQPGPGRCGRPPGGAARTAGGGRPRRLPSGAGGRQPWQEQDERRRGGWCGGRVQAWHRLPLGRANCCKGPRAAGSSRLLDAGPTAPSSASARPFTHPSPPACAAPPPSRSSPAPQTTAPACASWASMRTTWSLTSPPQTPRVSSALICLAQACRGGSLVQG
jgi:hypothetical protein